MHTSKCHLQLVHLTFFFHAFTTKKSKKEKELRLLRIFFVRLLFCSAALSFFFLPLFSFLSYCLISPQILLFLFIAFSLFTSLDFKRKLVSPFSVSSNIKTTVITSFFIFIFIFVLNAVSIFIIFSNFHLQETPTAAFALFCSWACSTIRKLLLLSYCVSIAYC